MAVLVLCGGRRGPLRSLAGRGELLPRTAAPESVCSTRQSCTRELRVGPTCDPVPPAWREQGPSSGGAAPPGPKAWRAQGSACTRCHAHSATRTDVRVPRARAYCATGPSPETRVQQSGAGGPPSLEGRAPAGTSAPERLGVQAHVQHKQEARDRGHLSYLERGWGRQVGADLDSKVLSVFRSDVLFTVTFLHLF